MMGLRDSHAVDCFQENGLMLLFKFTVSYRFGLDFNEKMQIMNSTTSSVE